jgi:hypothetical protein
MRKRFDENSFFKIEFKWLGHVVIPPSLHYSGKLYEFLYSEPKVPPQEVNFEKLSELQLLISGNHATASDNSILFANSDLELNSKEQGLRYMVLDCETNGLPIDFKNDYTVKSNWPKLLQLSWLICFAESSHEGYSPEKLYLLKRECRNIKPKNFELNLEAEQIHGLNLQILNLLGEDLKDVLNFFIKDLMEVSMIISHNFYFDKNVLLNEFIN